MLLTNLISSVAVRRNGCNECDHAISREQTSDMANITDVQIPVLLGVAQTVAEFLSNVVTVNDLQGAACRHEAAS